MGINYPYLEINSGEIEIVKVKELGICDCCCNNKNYFIDNKNKLSVFKFNSKLNFDVDNFINSINKILKKIL